MGCVCCSLSTFVSIVLHALERITLCTVCAMLVCCILFTILGVLIMGIGIGFHYCEVQNSVDAMANAAKAAGSMEQAENRRRGGQSQESKMLRSVNTAVKRGFAHRLGRRDRAEQLMPSNNNTINDLILGQNDSSNPASRRLKRDLTSNLTENGLDSASSPAIDATTVYFTNASLMYYDDIKQNFTIDNLEISYAPASSNISMHDATLLRQNCTLLNFFTRFLQF